MFLHVTVLHSFLLLNNIVWIIHIVLIYASTDEHLGCICILAIMQNAAVNIPVKFFVFCFHSLGCII